MKSKYSLIARTYPVLLTLLPLMVIGSYFSLNLNVYSHLITTIGLFGALSFLLTQIGRDFGKKKEPALWKEWGGTPSIQILRYSNTHLDEITKKRYHSRLNELCTVEHLPSKEMEKINHETSDAVYSTWTKFMIANTREIGKYKLLFNENINYGFRRNLWGLKSISISLQISGILIITVYNITKNGLNTILSWSCEYYFSIGILSFMLIFWTCIVTKEWIKRTAFSFAERLFELTEKINVP